MKDILRKLIRKLSGKPLAWLIYGLLHAIRATMRIDLVGNSLHDCVKRGEPFIGIFWHGRLLMLPFGYPGKRIHILIGTHRDGQLIADVMDCFGVNAVRGSSTKGGREAYREMIRILESGSDLGITPDGPKGPAEVLKPSVAHLAKLSGKPVIPIAFSASRFKRFNSWDRFLFPYPFSRGVYVVGESILYTEGEEMEEFRKRIEAALRDTTSRADAYFGSNG